MPDIGSNLREARMRRGIDITEAEADTKIRGKYLRALENEEWDLLPGPTFVKSFLRTYGDYLGLDGRMLVEEFKLGYERPEMQMIAPPRVTLERDRRDRRSRDRRPRDHRPREHRSGPSTRTWIIVALLVALALGLFLLGRGGSKPTGSAALPRTLAPLRAAAGPPAPIVLRSASEVLA